MISHQVKHSDDLFVYEYDLSTVLNFDILKSKALHFKDTYSNYNHKLMHNLFMSGYGVHRQTTDFDELVSAIETCANEKVASILSNINVDCTFKTYESWIVIYNKYGYVENHTHFPFGYSAVCYISADQTSSICFHDLEIIPTTGKLLIFPGILSHKVKPVLPQHSERIVFACNMYPTFDYSYFNQIEKHIK